MYKKRLWVFPSLLILLLVAGLLVGNTGGAAGQDLHPKPEKLDAILGGLLAPPFSRTQGSAAATEPQTEAEYQPETVPRAGKFSPFHTDAQGRTFVDVLIKTNGSLEGLAGHGVTIQGVVGTVAAARLPVTSVARLTTLPNVQFIEAARQLSPTNDVSVPATGAPIFRTKTGKDGSGVIVAAIDSGIDFAHQDFRKPDGTTRIKFICDQTDPPQAEDNKCPGNGLPDGGTLWTEAQINAALTGAGVVRQRDSVGHGSHVLGTAAGDDATYGGMAPGADIIMVNTSLFTNDIVSAMSFIDEKAASLGRPYVINISLGGHFGSHDGTDLESQAIDELTGSGKPGKVVVVSAGNEGDETIHASGDVSLGTNTVSFNIPSGAQEVLLDIWYAGQENFCFNFLDPGGGGLLSCVNPGGSFPTTANTFACKTGTNTCIIVIHSNTQANNNSKEVLFVIFARPSAGPGATIDLTGTWSFSLAGSVVSQGRFDAWIPVCFSSSPGACAFSAPHGDSGMTVAEPGVARNAITVGSYVTKDCWQSTVGQRCYASRPTVGAISSFSSKGPTRDGRLKPDIAAPGQGIVSSLSSAASFICVGGTADQVRAAGGKHTVCQGTSMAAPHVAGAVALLLAENPSRDAAQIKTLLQGQAIKDASTGASCGNTWGCGKLHIFSPATTAVANPPTANNLAEYAFNFDVNVGLPANVGEIRITFDKDTQIPAGISSSSVSMQADHLTNTSCATPPCADTLGANQVVSLTQDPTFGTDPTDSTRKVVILKVPDMDPGTTVESGGVGVQGIASGARVIVTFTTAAGIMNPTEQETSGFDLRACPSACAADETNNKISSGTMATVAIVAQLVLGTPDGQRGTVITLVGKGFKDGTTATVWLDANGNNVRDAGEIDLATAIVGADDSFTATITVNNPPFKPGFGSTGDQNIIAAIDGRNQTAPAASLPKFELRGQVTVTPTTAAVGDTIQITLKDFDTSSNLSSISPLTGYTTAPSVTLAGVTVAVPAGTTTDTNGEVTFSTKVPTAGIPIGTQRLAVANFCCVKGGGVVSTRGTNLTFGAVPVATALAPLINTGQLVLVSSFNYDTALFEAFVPNLPGNVLTVIRPHSVIFITLTQAHTVVVSGVSFPIRANTPTPVPVGATVTITLQ